MELGSQIRRFRAEKGWSQEELAEKTGVTRQTISNWENDRNYPDVRSLLLLGAVFGVSLDQLIKGDVEIMREKINIPESEIKRLNRESAVFAALLAATILSIVPILLWPSVPVFVCAAALYAITMWRAFRVERVKKDNDIYTYREIAAFMDGKRLDELAREREIGKRPYQQFLLAVGCALCVILLAGLVMWIVR